MTGRFGGRGPVLQVGAWLWLPWGFPTSRVPTRGTPTKSGFFRRRGRPQGCAPTVFFQYPMANIQCPMSKFFGRWFFGVGFGFSRLRGYPQGAPLRNRGFFLTSRATTGGCPYGFEFRLPTVFRGFLFRVLDVFALGRSAVLSVLVAGLLVVTILGLVGTD